MPVRSICIRDVDTAGQNESALTAAQRMRDRKVGTLVVLDDQGHPMGLISDRDLAIRIVAQERVRVRRVGIGRGEEPELARPLHDGRPVDAASVVRERQDDLATPRFKRLLNEKFKR